MRNPTPSSACALLASWLAAAASLAQAGTTTYHVDVSRTGKLLFSNSGNNDFWRAVTPGGLGLLGTLRRRLR